jgi:hypothetical protein
LRDTNLSLCPVKNSSEKCVQKVGTSWKQVAKT